MRALSGLTPALSRRLQRQLLASLPPRAATHLRRTLSLHAAPPAPAAGPARAHSADRQPDPDPEPEPEPIPECEPTPAQPEPIPEEPERADPPHYSTLPRLRRRSAARDLASPAEEGTSAALERSGSTDRPLLSKYLTPERALSLDEPTAAEEEAAAAAEGATRRHSLRLAGEGPRRRASRFLRSDFFERPSPEESLYARHKKEKELETQRILREIRERRTRADAAPGPGLGPGRTLDTPPPEDARKCASPLGSLLGKERSRSNTPFFPSLDNIKETAPPHSVAAAADGGQARARPADADSKLARPRSYPVKALDAIDEPAESGGGAGGGAAPAPDVADKRESRLMRPRSYPTASPSPEKVYVDRSAVRTDATKDRLAAPEVKSDVEVSFSITLPKRRVDAAPKPDAQKSDEAGTLVLKKYQIANGTSERSEHKAKNGSALANVELQEDADRSASNGDSKSKVVKKDDSKKSTDSEPSDKKGTIKKKIIRKVSSKSKTDLATALDATGDLKPAKKVPKKAKDKPTDEDGTKAATTVAKKKSVLQSIGHKLEKFASSKSSSPEKVAESSTSTDGKKNASKLKRTQREQSVPAAGEPPSESNLIKRAVTITDVAALENQPPTNNKTTVSKVLGLFKKFEPKDKVKPIMEKSLSVDPADMSITSEPAIEANIDSLDKDKPRRPTSLLLNGLGRKNKYGRTSSDTVSNVPALNDDQPAPKESETKNRNSLKLDFSKLPRVKKIVPTNPVIEPQLNYSPLDGETEKKYISEKIARALENGSNIDHTNSQSRSRSRSRSTISNSEIKSDLSADIKYLDRTPLSPSEQGTSHPLRNHESTSPEKEDMADRIRRKSFYSRFNEKKQRRKSSLVGPGATEYDPVARIHAPGPPAAEPKYEMSPTSPLPSLSPNPATCDLSPSAERYRTLLSELPRTNLKYENYGLNDKIDTYRSLDRNDFRKYPGTRSYLDYDQPSSYTQRYSRTKSLLDNADGTEGGLVHSLRDPLKYNRTISMYSPGNYATYRPKRTHNPAIILKENEKEPSPENILDKIRQRKNFSISVTRKPDRDTESVSRSPVPSKGESDGTECSEKVD